MRFTDESIAHCSGSIRSGKISVIYPSGSLWDSGALQSSINSHQDTDGRRTKIRSSELRNSTDERFITRWGAERKGRGVGVW